MRSGLEPSEASSPESTPTSKLSFFAQDDVETPHQELEDNSQQASFAFPSSEHGPSEASPAPVSSRLKRRRRCSREFLSRVLQFTLTCLVFLFLNADQNLLAPSLTIVAAEFNLTDQQRDFYLGGLLNLGFFTLGGIAAIIAGYMADVTRRKLLFTVVVLIANVSCVCVLFVTNFWSLFVTRLFCGVAIGGSAPIVFSMVGDIFVDEWRGRAASSLVIMSGAGVLFGQTLAGLIAPEWGWRVPFAVIGIPGVFVTLLFYFVTEEPKRAGAERVVRKLEEETDFELESYNEKMSWSKFCMLLRSKTMVLLLFLALPASLPWGFLLVYAQDFLIQDVGLATGESLIVVVVFSISSAVGTVIAGLVTDHYWKTNRTYVAWIAAGSLALGSLPLFLIVNLKMTFVGYCFCIFPSGLLTPIGGVAKTSMMLNCTLPETRGTAFAMNTLVDDLGKGLGSFIIAMMVVGLGGRIPAFNVAFAGWLLAAICFLATGWTLDADVKKKEQRLLQAVLSPTTKDNQPVIIQDGSETKISPATEQQAVSEEYAAAIV